MLQLVLNLYLYYSTKIFCPNGHGLVLGSIASAIEDICSLLLDIGKLRKGPGRKLDKNGLT